MVECVTGGNAAGPRIESRARHDSLFIAARIEASRDTSIARGISAGVLACERPISPACFDGGARAPLRGLKAERAPHRHGARSTRRGVLFFFFSNRSANEALRPAPASVESRAAQRSAASRGSCGSRAE